MTPKEMAGAFLYDARNRAKDVLMIIENACVLFENGGADRAATELGKAEHPAQMLEMLIEDARRKLRGAAK